MISSLQKADSKKEFMSWAVVVLAFNPSTQKADGGGSLWVHGQSDLQCVLQDSQGSYTEKPCILKKRKKEKKKEWNKKKEAREGGRKKGGGKEGS